MKLQSPKLYRESHVRQFELFDRRVLDLSGQHRRILKPEVKLDPTLDFIKTYRVALTIGSLFLLLVWQWHVAGVAMMRADKAERDMELNAQQAIQLSDALLKTQASRDRLERKMTGYSLPPAR